MSKVQLYRKAYKKLNESMKSRKVCFSRVPWFCSKDGKRQGTLEAVPHPGDKYAKKNGGCFEGAACWSRGKVSLNDPPIGSRDCRKERTVVNCKPLFQIEEKGGYEKILGHMVDGRGELIAEPWAAPKEEAIIHF